MDVEGRRTSELASTIETALDCTDLLARFFPDTEPVRVRAILMPLRSSGGKVRESVLLEFASAERAIFSSTLPLEFDDRVRLQNAQGGGQSDATVVAVQYHDGRKAIAVQFAGGPCDWVKRP